MKRQRPDPLDAIRRHALPVATVVAVVLLAGANWVQDPGQALRWLRSMLILPALLLGLTLWYLRIGRSPGSPDDTSARRRYFHSAQTLAVLAVGIPLVTSNALELWVRLGHRGASLDVEHRILGLSSAAVFLVVGNALPKILTPLSILPLALAERVTRARRTAGTILVILGVVMTVAFLAMPVPFATALARWCYIGGVTTVLVAIVWMNVGTAREER